MGRRNAVGDLFVTGLATCPEDEFATAVNKIKQMGFELILGSKTEELVCKMEQVEGVKAPTANRTVSPGTVIQISVVNGLRAITFCGQASKTEAEQVVD